MEDAFYARVDSYIQALSKRKQEKFVIKSETHKQVVQILKKEEGNFGAKFKFWAKQRFYLVKISDQEILYSSKEKLPVVIFENLFQKIDECHTAVGHLGRDKTWHEVKY
jgi:hypothetical protein